MKRQGHLFENVVGFDALKAAAKRAMHGKALSKQLACFHLNLEKEILDLQHHLTAGTYQPRPYRCFYVYDPKRRYICAADLRDQTVHHAICHVLEPIFERRFIHDSYACRKGKGTHKAIQKVRSFAKKRRYFLKADVLKFFESVDHHILKQMLRRIIKDERMLSLMSVIIDHPVPGHQKGKGLAIGNLTSQWWANFYLDFPDHFVKDEKGVQCYVRYMDDFVIFADDKEALHRLKADIGAFLNCRLRLSYKRDVTYIAPVTQGLPFLGFRIFPNLMRLTARNRTRFTKNIKQKEAAYIAGEIDEDALIRSITSIVGHMQHADTWRLRQKLFFNEPP